MLISRMMTAAMALAETIAAMSPCGVQTTKLNLNYARDHNLQDSLDFAVSGMFEVCSVKVPIAYLHQDFIIRGYSEKGSLLKI